jgi:hypothetical protein
MVLNISMEHQGHMEREREMSAIGGELLEANFGRFWAIVDDRGFDVSRLLACVGWTHDGGGGYLGATTT